MAVHRVDKPFTCKICNKSYSRATVLSQHMKIHNDPQIFKCNICNKIFSNELALKTHEPVHTLHELQQTINDNATVNIDDEPPTELTTMTTLKPIETIKSSIQLQTVEMLFDGNESTERIELDQHFDAIVDDEIDDEDDIDEEFVMMTQVKLTSTIQSLPQLAPLPPPPVPLPQSIISQSEPPTIITINNIEQTVKRISCNLCGKQFKDDTELCLHTKNHSCEKYKCDICFKRFSILSNFNVHKKIHKRDKPFRCEVCGKSFRLAKSLTVHMALHAETEIDSFNCEICQRSFGRSGSLKLHMKSHANSESQRQYIDMLCNDDGDDHIIDDDEQQIMYEYIDEKPTYCDICNKKFVRSSGNMRTHKCNKFNSNDDIDMDNHDDHTNTIDYWNCD